ncbi:MAG TPA: phosphoglycerate mutase family protein, partial [Candidatus Bathyarchaeia archaeon]|nr:phosphoglycerate mutase family protein [Candidatus Bathyarchaeia archaeon]
MDALERDAERPLTAEGHREITEVADFIARLHVRFTVIASSPLKRAVGTAEIVARRLRSVNMVQEWEELLPTGDSAEL